MIVVYWQRREDGAVHTVEVEEIEDEVVVVAAAVAEVVVAAAAAVAIREDTRPQLLCSSGVVILQHQLNLHWTAWIMNSCWMGFHT